MHYDFFHKRCWEKFKLNRGLVAKKKKAWKAVFCTSAYFSAKRLQATKCGWFLRKLPFRPNIACKIWKAIWISFLKHIWFISAWVAAFQIFSEMWLDFCGKKSAKYLFFAFSLIFGEVFLYRSQIWAYFHKIQSVSAQKCEKSSVLASLKVAKAALLPFSWNLWKSRKFHVLSEFQRLVTGSNFPNCCVLHFFCVVWRVNS